MTPDHIREILEAVSKGSLPVEEALQTLRDLPFEDLGFAKIDHHRALRRGFPEVIFGPGKARDQIRDIAVRLAERGHNVLITKTTAEVHHAVADVLPEARWHEDARAIVVARQASTDLPARILVMSAGTSDVPVAAEAALTAELMGARVDRLYDVGVAGLHRLTAHRELLAAADAVIVVAGMEGALPSVVSGLVAVPVVAVPTSIGYGASFGGLAALLAMLNSCSSGIAIVNIDNGFGAGYLAALMMLRGRAPDGSRPIASGRNRAKS